MLAAVVLISCTRSPFSCPALGFAVSLSHGFPVMGVFVEGKKQADLVQCRKSYALQNIRVWWYLESRTDDDRLGILAGKSWKRKRDEKRRKLLSRVWT